MSSRNKTASYGTPSSSWKGAFVPSPDVRSHCPSQYAAVAMSLSLLCSIGEPMYFPCGFRLASAGLERGRHQQRRS